MKIIITSKFNQNNVLLLSVLLLILIGILAIPSQNNNQILSLSKDVGIVRIVEVMSTNISLCLNSDGVICDYVKLKNTSDTAVNLFGWGLSDSFSKMKFSFSECILQPDESIFVFLNQQQIDRSSLELYANFALSSSGESVILFKPNGEYADVVQVPAMNDNEVYVLSEGEWKVSEYSSYVNTGIVYRNGLLINEIMSKNETYAIGEETCICDYIELVNNSDSYVVLSDYALSTNMDHLQRFIFPENAVLQPGEIALVLCTDQAVSGDNIYTGAPFGLSREGESVYLYNRRQCAIQDAVTIPPLALDHSYSRDSMEWNADMKPTPGLPNTQEGLAIEDARLRARNRLDVFISEILASNLSVSLPGVKGFYDYIELYNASDYDVDLSGCFLTDDPKKPRKWMIEDMMIPSGGYRLIYCEPDNLDLSTDTVRYANFRLTSGNCSVYLYDQTGMLLDRIQAPPLPSNVSYGRSLGEMGLLYYSSPTPNTANASGFAGYSMSPAFSVSGGVYEHPVTVEIEYPADALVYYTLDGSDPDESSAVYTQPIEIDHTTTLRACAAQEELALSPVITQTYFISVYHTLPIIALTTDPDNLWNETNGMLADGSDLDRETQKRPWQNATYAKKTKNIGFIEYYDTDGVQILSQGMIFNCMGQFSLDMPQKSFSVKANSQFGNSMFDASLFDDRPYTSYAELAIRNGGQDGLYTRVLDGLQARLVEQAGSSVVTQAWKPVIVYLDGSYWGHFNLRERIGIDMIAQHEGWVEPEHIDLLEGNGTGRGNVNHGSNTDYVKLVDYAKSHDLSADPNALTYVLEQVDLDNMLDYFFFEMFFGNEDAGNIRFYRNAVSGDGKWRYVFYDLDWGLFDSSYGGPAFVLNPEGMGEHQITSNILLVRLMEAHEIRDRFLIRSGQLFQTVLTTENMISLFDQMIEEIRPEMRMHFNRWASEMYPQISADQPKNPQGAYAYWEQRVERAKNVMKKRPTIFWNMIKETFDLTEQAMIDYYGECPIMPADAI